MREFALSFLGWPLVFALSDTGEGWAAAASVAVSQQAIAAFTGDGSASDPQGLAFDGSALYFFESHSVANGDPLRASRALIRCGWPGSALSLYLQAEDMTAALSEPSGSVLSLLDMAAVAPGRLVLLVRSDGEEHLLDNLAQGLCREFVPLEDSNGAIAVAFDASANRVWVLFGAEVTNPGLGWISVADSSGGLNVVATDAALEAAITTPGTRRWLPTDLAVLPNGDVLVYNSGPNVGTASGDLGSDGDCVRVTPAGAVSLHFDRGVLDAAVSDPGTTGYGEAALAVQADGHLLVLSFEADTGGATTEEEFLARISPDGSSANVVIEEAEIISDLGPPSSDLSFTRKGFVLDQFGNALWSAAGSGIPHGILQISAPVPAELSVFQAE